MRKECPPSIKELVRLMEKVGEKYDYSNWGICSDGDELYLGPNDRGLTVSVPLLDIIEFAEENLPNYGLEELFVVFGHEEDGSVGWCIGRRA